MRWEFRVTAGVAFAALVGGVALLLWGTLRVFPDQFRAGALVGGMTAVVLAPVLAVLAWTRVRLDEPALLGWVRRSVLLASVYVGLAAIGNVLAA